MCEIDVARIIAALETVRAPAMPGEYDLHGMIAAALEGAGIPCVHEYRLAPRCRIDFLCGNVGIEVKKGRPVPAQLRKQLSRYLASDEVSQVVVVMQRAVGMPETISGKRVHVVSLNMNWGIALP
jgi:hypothetical protein